MRILSENEIRAAVTVKDAVDAVEKAFAAMARGLARIPEVINLDIPEVRGEIHVKGAFIQGDPYCAFKIATGFYDNPSKGLPTGSGVMIALNAENGLIEVLLQDNGYLTDLRTGAAGAVAANYLARTDVQKVAVVGAGTQARFQLRALAVVRHIPQVHVYDIERHHAERCCAELGPELRIDITPVDSAEVAVRDADLLYTLTPSREPLVKAEWLSEGIHINAVGSDGPEKQELECDVFSRAQLIFADRIAQCTRFGELHHAIDAGIIEERDITGELGEIIAGLKSGRSGAQQISVCDLTGVGIQDAAMVNLVMRSAI